MTSLRLLVLLALVATAAHAAEPAALFASVIESKGRAPERERAHELFRLVWDVSLKENPERATMFGRPGYDHLWTDVSPEAIARRKQISHEALRALQSIDAAQLGDVDRVSYELLKDQLTERIAGEKFPEELLEINQLDGVQQDAAVTMTFMPNATVAQLEAQLGRLKALPKLIKQNIALLETGSPAALPHRGSRCATCRNKCSTKSSTIR